MSEAPLIHVDVRRDETTGDFRVEASTDGAPFALQFLLGRTVGDTDDDVRLRAEQCARTFLAGVRYAGHENVRGTSCGYAL